MAVCVDRIAARFIFGYGLDPTALLWGRQRTLDMEPATSFTPASSQSFRPFGAPGGPGEILDALTRGRTWRVGAESLDDCPTIAAALALAASGDRILIGPGRYREALLELLVPLEVVARDGRGSVVIEAVDHDGFHVVSDSRLRGLEVHRLGEVHPDSETVAAVAVVAGRAVIEDCRLSAPALNGHGLLAVTPLARPLLKASEISDCAGIGAVALGGAAITMSGGSVVRDGKTDGLMAGGPNSRLTLIDAFVRGNGGSGAILDAGAVGAMEGCVFEGNARAGVWVSGPHSVLRLEDSRSCGQGVGVVVGPGAEALLSHVTIVANRQRAVLVDGAGARAIIEEKSLLDGGEIALVVQNGAIAWDLHNTIRGATMAGVSALGAGTVLESERSQITAIEQFGILVSEGASARLIADRISECEYGLVVKTDHGGRVRAISNDIFGNAQGLFIYSGRTELESNRVRLNRGFGLFLAAGVRPRMRANDIHDNGIDLKREDGHYLARALGYLGAWRRID